MIDDQDDILLRGNAQAREFARKVMQAVGVRSVTPQDFPHPKHDPYRILVKTRNTPIS